MQWTPIIATHILYFCNVLYLILLMVSLYNMLLTTYTDVRIVRTHFSLIILVFLLLATHKNLVYQSVNDITIVELGCRVQCLGHPQIVNQLATDKSRYLAVPLQYL